MADKVVVNPQYERMETFVRSIPVVFQSGGRLIYDKRNQVRLFDVDGATVAVKRFRIPYLHQRIDYTFIRPSKARRAYEYAVRLVELGISTPDPIAYIETHKYGLFYQGYFVSACCDDPDTRFLRSDYEEHDDLIDAIARFIVKMHEDGFIHGDANLSNFLYHKDGDNYHITTIDINRSHFRANPSKKACLKSLVRLTHVRPLMRKIVGRYAELRGWDVNRSVGYVEYRLTKFEHRKGR